MKLLLICILVLMALAPAASAADDEPAVVARRTLVLDGSAVHDIGNVQLNVTNWGLIGSRPGTGAPYSGAPSLEYLGVDHLWAAGLWIGGIVNGEPRVSTGQYEVELLADPDDPADTIYASREKAKGQRRYPAGHADDDNDRLEDEDPLDGRDNDGDGKVDEDGAAIGDQYFRAVMRDDTELAQDIYPDHSPLGIEVVQESFQWEDERFDDFVGMRFTIVNRSDAMIEDVYVGMFADFDIGNASNDWARYHDGPVTAWDGSTVNVQLARAVSEQAAEGAHAGVVLASREMVASSFQVYSGNLPFDQGGDPTNDAERYESLSSGAFDAGNDRYNDIRILLAVGPFEELAPGESATVDLAFVVGATLDELVQNAANAVRLGQGALVDRDRDAATGVDGREFHVPWIEVKGRLKDKGSGPMRLAARPNPFNPRVEFMFDLPATASTQIDVYDARGRHVAAVFDEVLAAGPGRVVWNGVDGSGRAVSSGVYFVQLRQGQMTETIRAVVVR